MKRFRIVLFTLLIGFTPLSLLYSAKRAAGYIPLPREVLSKAEYTNIYHGSLSLDQKIPKLKQLRQKYKNDPYKTKGIDRGIREIEFQIRHSR